MGWATIWRRSASGCATCSARVPGRRRRLSRRAVCWGYDPAPREGAASTSQGRPRTVFARALQIGNPRRRRSARAGPDQPRRGARADDPHRAQGTAPALEGRCAVARAVRPGAGADAQRGGSGDLCAWRTCRRTAARSDPPATGARRGVLGAAAGLAPDESAAQVAPGSCVFVIRDGQRECYADLAAQPRRR